MDNQLPPCRLFGNCPLCNAEYEARKSAPLPAGLTVGIYPKVFKFKIPWYHRAWAWFRAGWKEYQQYLQGGRP
jgi:hypothetical protein